jgi:hypothetical protein
MGPCAFANESDVPQRRLSIDLLAVGYIRHSLDHSTVAVLSLDLDVADPRPGTPSAMSSCIRSRLVMR